MIDMYGKREEIIEIDHDEIKDNGCTVDNGSKYYYLDVWDLSNRDLDTIPDRVVKFFDPENQSKINEPFWGVLDLSYNNISTIPESLNIEIMWGLNLSHNQLTSIPDHFHFRDAQIIDLSHNRFSRTPLSILNNTPNLLELNLDNNQIRNLKVSEMKKLLDIKHVSLQNNLLQNDFTEKVNAAIRIGLIDLEEIRFNKFKYREEKINPPSYKKNIWGRIDKQHMFYTKKNEVYDYKYIKFFRILSVDRFVYCENVAYEMERNPDIQYPWYSDDIDFWEQLKAKIYKFKDIEILSSSVDNYLILRLTNRDRLIEFEEFIPVLFGHNLVT